MGKTRIWGKRGHGEAQKSPDDGVKAPGVRHDDQYPVEDVRPTLETGKGGENVANASPGLRALYYEGRTWLKDLWDTRNSLAMASLPKIGFMMPSCRPLPREPDHASRVDKSEPTYRLEIFIV